MFSQQNVAGYINRNFEPAWESLRPVPMVKIDFGNGTVVTRTLHGNIATSVCTADGQVLDMLPGIYSPDIYVERLYQFRLLANYSRQVCSRGIAAHVADYHHGQADALRKNAAPPVFINMDMSKAAIESRIKAVLVPARTAGLEGTVVTQVARKGTSAVKDVASWEELAADTLLNEKVRRLQIHEILERKGLARPDAITKSIYKEVLHTDLDDPYLGLGGMLFGNYPFAEGTTKTAAR